MKKVAIVIAVMLGLILMPAASADSVDPFGGNHTCDNRPDPWQLDQIMRMHGENYQPGRAFTAEVTGANGNYAQIPVTANSLGNINFSLPKFSFNPGVGRASMDIVDAVNGHIPCTNFFQVVR